MSLRFLVVVSMLLLSFASVSAQDPQVSIKAGSTLVSGENYELAIREYERVTAKDHDAYAQANYNIGVCYFELYRNEQAIEYFKRAIGLRKGDYPRASYALGFALEEQNKLNEADAAYYDAVVSSHNDYAPASFRRGVIAAKKGKVEVAADLFREASKHRGPHLPNGLNNLGVMLARMGNLSEAEKVFEYAVRQSRGTSSDAEQNLKLCRSLLLSAANRTVVLELKLAASDLPR